MNVEYFIPIIAGILVSFTPCVAVLFPITMYRFMSDKGIDRSSYLLYVAGFVLTFILAGFLFQEFFESQIQNGIKLAVAVILICLGILQFLNRINPLNLKPVKNTFLFGMVFAVAVGINPCSIPYLGTLFALSSGVEIASKLFLFALGILIAPTLFLMFGNSFISKSRVLSKKMHYIEKPMSILLIVSGAYMGLHILALSQVDLIISSAVMLILLLIILKIFFTEKSFKDLLTIPRILLLISLVMVWFVITYHCYGMITNQAAVCSLTCEVCQRCLIVFSAAIVLGIIGSLALERYETKKQI